MVAHTFKIAGTVVFIIVGVALFGLGIFLIIKYRRIVKLEGGSD